MFKTIGDYTSPVWFSLVAACPVKSSHVYLFWLYVSGSVGFCCVSFCLVMPGQVMFRPVTSCQVMFNSFWLYRSFLVTFGLVLPRLVESSHVPLNWLYEFGLVWSSPVKSSHVMPSHALSSRVESSHVYPILFF